MCGIVGIFDAIGRHAPGCKLLGRMMEKLKHRGPDDSGDFTNEEIALGFLRLSILDLERGNQPMFNEDGTVVSICNGELYNFRSLKNDLLQKGHRFKTANDCEIIPHLYEEYGINFLDHLNGQFAFSLYDLKAKILYLARDHFGVCPLYYACAGGICVFSSEIKAILEHPMMPRKVNLKALEQLLLFPGTFSTQTMFEGIESVPSGHYVKVDASGPSLHEYWDLDYPRVGDLPSQQPEEFYIDGLSALLLKSTASRLQSDVPVGIYLSGGLDSSLIAGMVKSLCPEKPRRTFSVSFGGDEMCEARYQQQMAHRLNSLHTDIPYDTQNVVRDLMDAIYHAECPLKETHDTASLALSHAAKCSGTSVAMTGQGADEIFAGYIGYRFDQFYSDRPSGGREINLNERNLRKRLWGDERLAYEHDLLSARRFNSTLYSDDVRDVVERFDWDELAPVNKERLEGRHLIHKRSYLDFKMRLSDHLLTDHGDRMAMANSVELRHPFLDKDVIAFATQIPPELKLNGYTEKYILKQVAKAFVGSEITEREKFGWYTPGSPALLRSGDGCVDDLLSPDIIKKQGYFNSDTVEALKAKYLQDGFMLNQPFESDILTVVLTFGMFLKTFDLPDFR